MKTKFFLKAFGTANVTLILLSFLIAVLVINIPGVEDMFTHGQDKCAIVAEMLAILSITMFAFGFLNGLLSLIVNYDWKK